ncbi:MAG TPA: hypothetical protein PLE19_06495 [Planctomycetota bacterium]|nr:hypothetical protein [Planctomycetota bacterium]HRR81046.1 hypothetical protein [Planctomycetota bacterium]HRU04714.1 hypothetical protein [Candidatus Brocadiia bacterium]
MIPYRCECGKVYPLADEHAGAQVTCPVCNRVGTIALADGQVSQGDRARSSDDLDRLTITTDAGKLAFRLLMAHRFIVGAVKRYASLVTTDATEPNVPLSTDVRGREGDEIIAREIEAILGRDLVKRLLVTIESVPPFVPGQEVVSADESAASAIFAAQCRLEEAARPILPKVFTDDPLGDGLFKRDRWIWPRLPLAQRGMPWQLYWQRMGSTPNAICSKLRHVMNVEEHSLNREYEQSPKGGLSKKPRRRRRASEAASKLTVRQLEAVQIVGECKGNFTEAARRMGLKDPKSVRELYEKGVRKAGVAAVLKPKMIREAQDRRGQSLIADKDEGEGVKTLGPAARGTVLKDRRW